MDKFIDPNVVETQQRLGAGTPAPTSPYTAPSSGFVDPNAPSVPPPTGTPTTATSSSTGTPSLWHNFGRGLVKGTPNIPLPMTGFERPEHMEAIDQYNRQTNKNIKEGSRDRAAEQMFPNPANTATGRVVEKAGEGAAESLPFTPLGPGSAIIGGAVGGAGAQAAKEAGAGDTLSTIAGVAAGVAAEPPLRGLTNLTLKTAKSIPEQFGIWQSRVNSLYSDLGYGGQRIAGATRPESQLMDWQNTLRYTRGSAPQIREAESLLFRQIEHRADQMANRMGPNYTQQELGEHVVGLAGQRADDIRTEIGDMFNALGTMRSTNEVFPQSYLTALINLESKYHGAPETARLFEQFNVGNYLRAAGRDIINSGNHTLPYQVLQNMRTDLGQSVQKGMVNGSVNTHEVRNLYRALTRDMESAFQTPEGRAAFQAVNREAERQFDILDRTIQPLLQKGITPETITQRILAQSAKGGTRIDDITTELNQVDPNARNTIMSFVLRNLGDMPNNRFSPSRFYDNWQKLSPEARNLFGMHEEGVNRLAELSGLVKDSFRAANLSGTAEINNFSHDLKRAISSLAGMAGAGIGAGIGGSGAFMTDPTYARGAMAAGSVAGAMIASKAADAASVLFLEPAAASMMAKLWTSKVFNVWLGTDALRLPPNKALAGLTALVAQDPDLKPAVDYLNAYILTPLKEGINSVQEQMPFSKPKFAQGGLVEDGNIDLTRRPSVPAPEGGTATVRSISIGTDRGTVNLPTVAKEGRIMSEDEAIDHYLKTGEHLGIHDSDEAASKSAKEISFNQSKSYQQYDYAQGGPVDINKQSMPLEMAGYSGGTRTPIPPSSIGINSAAKNDPFYKSADATQNIINQFKTIEEMNANRQKEGFDNKTWYHGSAKGFEQPDPYRSEYGLYGQGTYLTENPEVASSYTKKGMNKAGNELAQTVHPLNINVKNTLDMDGPADMNKWSQTEIFKRFVDPEFLSKNPTNNEVYKHIEENIAAEETYPTWEVGEMMQENIRNMGYDSITHIGGRGDKTKHKVMIIFEPENMKSSISGFAEGGPVISDTLDEEKIGEITAEWGTGKTSTGILDGAGIYGKQKSILEIWDQEIADKNKTILDAELNKNRQDILIRRPQEAGNPVALDFETNRVARSSEDRERFDRINRKRTIERGEDIIVRPGDWGHYTPEDYKRDNRSFWPFAEGGAVGGPIQKTAQALTMMGVAPEVAKGAAKYMYTNESKLDPNIVNPTSGAYGIAQWLGPRKTALFNKYGNKPSFDQQLNHMQDELSTSERSTLQALLKVKTEKEGYDIWGRMFERPGEQALAKAGVNYKPGEMGDKFAKEQTSISFGDDKEGLDKEIAELQYPQEGITNTLLKTERDPGTRSIIASILAQPGLLHNSQGEMNVT